MIIKTRSKREVIEYMLSVAYFNGHSICKNTNADVRAVSHILNDLYNKGYLNREEKFVKYTSGRGRVTFLYSIKEEKRSELTISIRE